MATNTKIRRARAASAYDLALCESILPLIEREHLVRLADLRARARAWATRGDLRRTVDDLAARGMLRLIGGADGPVIGCRPVRATGRDNDSGNA